MRIFSFIPAFAVLATALTGAALPVEPGQDNCGYEVGCELAQSAAKRDFFEYPTHTARGLTNAALLRRGLPLNKPIMRRGTPVRRTQADPSKVPEPKPEPKPEPEPGKIRRRGVIRVRSQSDGSIGYVSRSPSTQAQYHYDSDAANALIVTFETDSTGSGTQLNVVPENSDITYSGFVGLIQGRDDTNSVLSSGSFHYLYLSNTHGTAPGSPPEDAGNAYTDVTGAQRTSESAVWTYDSATTHLSPYWVNPDGSTPTVEYFLQSNLIYISGDADAFHSRYPAPVTRVTLEFVQISLPSQLGSDHGH